MCMWCVVWVQTGQEQITKDMCMKILDDKEKSGLFEECFIPMKEKAWKKEGRWIRKKEILFPGYLFFVTEDSAALQNAFKRIPRFTKILGDNDGAIPLRPHEIQFLKKYTNKERVLEMSTADLIGGELVVTSGPLENYQGKVVHIDRRKRECTLEMEFFGRITRINVGLNVVRKLEQ